MSPPVIVLYPGRAGSIGADLPAVPPVTWIGSPNFWAGRPTQPIAIVIHTMDGSLAGTDSVFNDPTVPDAKRVSANFGVALDGRVHQYVKLDDRAWANGILEHGNRWFGPSGVNPNDLTVSIETEDLHNSATAVSDAQYEAVGGLCRLILERFGSIKSITSHHVISPLSRPDCCGARWTQPHDGHALSRIAALAMAAKLELRI